MTTTRTRTGRRRGISRIDQDSTRTHGWFVRVGYHERRDGGYGPRHTKFFGDIGHGGKRRALEAAEKFITQIARAGVSIARATKKVAKKTRRTVKTIRRKAA